jgi:L,D-peptidoglycan transpeptidase YkuD (ErfK/YbiS/YcfS/YnhG family)
MIIKLKNKDTLDVEGFKFKCSVGKNGLTSNKREGDKKTPKGIFELENLYYRNDKFKKPETMLKCIPIKKNMGWCHDVNNQEKYNKLIKINKKIKYEKMFRSDKKYDFLIPIKYNFKKPKVGKGSAIFIHLTKDYKPTAGCIAIKLQDFLVLIKLLKRSTRIKIK